MGERDLTESSDCVIADLRPAHGQLSELGPCTSDATI
jgi:hypothetical protein